MQLCGSLSILWHCLSLGLEIHWLLCPRCCSLCGRVSQRGTGCFGEKNPIVLKFCLYESLPKHAFTVIFVLKGRHLFLFLKIIVEIKLIYSVFTFCCTLKWISYTYTYIHCFLDSFPIKVITGYWVEFPVLYSGSLLVIYLIYSSVHMSIPISQFIPLENHMDREAWQAAVHRVA